MAIRDADPKLALAGHAVGGVCGSAPCTLTTMLGEISHKRFHPFEICAVDQVAASLLDSDNFGVRELFQMEGERTSGDTESIRHGAWRQTFWACDDKRPKGTQPLGLSKRAERMNDIDFPKCFVSAVSRDGLHEQSTLQMI